MCRDVCAFVPLVYYPSLPRPPAIQMSRGAGVARGRRPNAVWWGEREGSNKPSLWIMECSSLRALCKLAWLHMHRAPRARRSLHQPKDNGDITWTSRAFERTTELSQKHNHRGCVLIYSCGAGFFCLLWKFSNIYVQVVFFPSPTSLLATRQTQTHLHH